MKPKRCHCHISCWISASKAFAVIFFAKMLTARIITVKRMALPIAGKSRFKIGVKLKTIVVIIMAAIKLFISDCFGISYQCRVCLKVLWSLLLVF